jgi:hypothetical protein
MKVNEIKVDKLEEKHFKDEKYYDCERKYKKYMDYSVDVKYSKEERSFLDCLKEAMRMEGKS